MAHHQASNKQLYLTAIHGRLHKQPLTELHAHLSTSINPAILWSIAHAQGIKLPTKDYWEFLDLICLSPSKKTTLKDYLDNIYHPILNKISSGTYAVERAVHETIGGAYRSNNITIIELRTNPMKHNMGGQQDLDHIIMAMLRGMDRALLEYPQIRAGLIFCLDRQFSLEKNIIISKKAIKYRKRGVVGIDFGNYNKKVFSFKEYQEVFKDCQKHGLGITVHSGETDDTNDLWDVIRYVKPSRIGHGIKAAYDNKLMQVLAENKIVLEICPSSNLATQAVKNIDELKFILKTFIKNKVLFTINTDWPEIVENAHLKKEFKLLLDNKILTEEDVLKCIKIAQKATFVKKGGINAYL